MTLFSIGDARAWGWLVWLGQRGWLGRRQQRTLLAARFDGVAESVVVSDLNGVIIYVNASAADLIGTPKDRLIGCDYKVAVPLYDASGASYDAYDRVAFATGPEAIALPILRVTGRPDKWLSVRIAPLRDGLRAGTARVVGMVTTLCDGEERLHDLEEIAHASDVIAASADAIIGLSADLTIRHWNNGARKLLSYFDDDMLGESILLLVSAERRHALRQLLIVARDGGPISDRDLTVRNRDGRDIDVSLSAFVKPSGGAHRVSEMVVMLRDIDVRRIAERRVRHLGAQLVRRAQELQAIFDIAPVGMVIADSPDCVHLRANLALARALGKERASEVVLGEGAPYAFWRDGVPMPADSTPLHLAVAQRRVIEPIELEVRIDGSASTMIAYAAPVIDQDNIVIGAIAVFVDITAMKRVHAEHQRLLTEAIAARATAEDASRLKEEFLATVSHELRTPLNAMHGWLEIMQRKPDPETQARGLDVIRRNVRAQTRVIEDILDVSAFVTGKTRLAPRPIDLLEVVRAAVESMRPTAEAKSITLTMCSDVASAPVTGDVERLQQVAWNLLSNAVKFTQSGGQVVLCLASVADHEDDAQWVMSVIDSGEGIEAGFLPYVFDRFRQADSSVERRHSGLGLGLAIVRHLVELHGGHVAVDSPGRGQGATFRVFLPARVVQAETLPTALHASPTDSTSKAGSDTRLSAPSEADAPVSIAMRGAVNVAGRPGLPDRRERDGVGAIASMAGGGKHHDATTSDLAGVDILLVEDDASAADMLSYALRDDGAQVRVAHSAAAAWEYLIVRRPDVIISDIGMPERDGCSLMRAWREREHSPDTALENIGSEDRGSDAIAVRAKRQASGNASHSANQHAGRDGNRPGRLFAIAVTAYARPEDRERVMRAGFDAFLTKPIVPSMVKTLVMERLGIIFAVNP